ncbi:MAG TPA: hypothetical protein VF278_06815, partial [Pirellulales bacterium]
MSGARKSNPIQSVSAAAATGVPRQTASPRQGVIEKEPTSKPRPESVPAASRPPDSDGAGDPRWSDLPKRREWLLPMLLAAIFRVLLFASLLLASACFFFLWREASNLGQHVAALAELSPRLAKNDEKLGVLSSGMEHFDNDAKARQGELARLRDASANVSGELEKLRASNAELVGLREKLDRLQVPSSGLRIEPAAVMVIALHSKELPQDKYVKVYQRVFEGLPRIGDHLVGLTIYTTGQPRTILDLGVNPKEGIWQKLPPSDIASENLNDVNLAGLFGEATNAKRVIVVSSAHCRPPTSPDWQSYAVDALLIARKNAELSEWAAFCGSHRGTLSAVPEGDTAA